MSDNLAYIVENDVIQEAIKRKLDSLKDRVNVKYGTYAKSFVIPGATKNQDSNHNNSWVSMDLSDESSLRTKLLVRK